MRILAIRGRNLASLAGDFEVDFQREPLVSTGLYAISGPTGSGKSTLLDALCLALYQKTPRLQRAESRGGVPDGEYSLTPQDSRTLLRRGSSEGHAEVDFVGIDGLVWRARWAVRRARGQEQGKLQDVERTLHRLHDGQAWPGHKRELQAEIIRLTGLDFEQFCRSVLLAQGEFAALLKAKADERGQLLEALTGTGIFQQLSKAAHERARQARAEEEALKQALGLEAPLSDDARTALQAELAATLQEIDTAQATLVGVDAEARWHAEGLQRATRLQSLTVERERVAAELAALDAPALEAAAQARQLAAPLAAVESAQARIGAIDTEHRAREAALAAHDASLAEAGAALQMATRDTTARREARQQAEPALIAARAADAELARLRREYAALTTPLAELSDAQQSLTRQQQAIEAELAGLGRAAEDYADWRAAHPAWADPALDWGARGAALDELQTLEQRLTELAAVQTRLAAQLAAAEAHRDAAQAELSAADAALQAAAADRQQARTELDAGDSAETLQTLREALQQRAQRLDALASALNDAERLELARSAARAAVTEAEARLQTADAQQAAAVAAEAGLDADVAALRRSHERLRLRADAHTAALRQSLVSGEPCPVCGATDHPGGAETPAAGLLSALADELAHAERSHRAARQQRETCALAATRADQIARQSHAEAERAAQAAEAARQTLIPQLAALALRAEDVADGPTALDTLRAPLRREQADLAARSAARSTRVARLEQARATEERAHADLQQARSRRDQAELALIAPREQLARARGEQASLEQHRTTRQRGVEADGLDLADLPRLLQTHRAGLALKLRADADARTRADRLQTLERLAQQAAHQSQRLAELGARRDALALAGEAAQTTRRAALDAPDAEAHAAGLDAAIRQAEAAEAIARAATSEAQQARDAARAALATTRTEAAAAAVAVQERRERLTEALRAWRPELDPDAALTALRAQLATLPATLDADLARLAERREQQQRLQFEHEALATEHQAWLDAAGSTRSPQAVEQARLALRQQLGERQAALGALRHQLAEDEQRRIRSREKLAELDALVHANRCWHQLTQLIGAYDGSAFRQYAQQFTLEVLIEHANANLSELAPRYRLCPGSEALSLLMIDTDFGDERRSVHSLSGGESFLVSLALALGLAEMAAERIRVESLFIDEGFGSLDADTLAVALQALDRLQAQGRRIGVISHVPDMAERIGVQVRIRPRGPGRSSVEVLG